MHMSPMPYLIGVYAFEKPQSTQGLGAVLSLFHIADCHLSWKFQLAGF